MLMVTVDFGYSASLLLVAIIALGLFGEALARLAVRPFANRRSGVWVLQLA